MIRLNYIKIGPEVFQVQLESFSNREGLHLNRCSFIELNLDGHEKISQNPAAELSDLLGSEEAH